MPCQPFHKQHPSNRLPAIPLHAVHPPLTSLRSFAPPYAGAKGAYRLPSLMGEMPEGQRGLHIIVGARPRGCPGAVPGTPDSPQSSTSHHHAKSPWRRVPPPHRRPVHINRNPQINHSPMIGATVQRAVCAVRSMARCSAIRRARRTPPRTGAATRACPYGVRSTLGVRHGFHTQHHGARFRCARRTDMHAVAPS